MSKAQSPGEKISQHSDDLAELAESDLPCADIANALLEIAEEGEV